MSPLLSPRYQIYLQITCEQVEERCFTNRITKQHSLVSGTQVQIASGTCPVKSSFIYCK